MHVNIHLKLLCCSALALNLWGCPQFQQQNNDPVDPDPTPDVTPDLVQDLEPMQQRSCATQVRFDAPQSVASVSIAGEFNQWDEQANPLERVEGQWRTSLVLPPGEYAYKFVLDGEYEGQPPVEVPTKWSGGFENRSLQVADCQRPLWDVITSEVTSDGQVRVQLSPMPGRAVHVSDSSQ